jgi:hypothetical protein
VHQLVLVTGLDDHGNAAGVVDPVAAGIGQPARARGCGTTRYPQVLAGCFRFSPADAELTRLFRDSEVDHAPSPDQQPGLGKQPQGPRVSGPRGAQRRATRTRRERDHTEDDLEGDRWRDGVDELITGQRRRRSYRRSAVRPHIRRQCAGRPWRTGMSSRARSQNQRDPEDGRSARHFRSLAPPVARMQGTPRRPPHAGRDTSMAPVHSAVRSAVVRTLNWHSPLRSATGFDAVVRTVRGAGTAGLLRAPRRP